MINKAEKLAKAIEFTHLDNTATIDEMKAFFAKAKEYPFYAVVVLPHFVKLAKEELKDTDMKVVTVIDFPLGAGNTEGKVAEAKAAIANGADEIDMMANIPSIKERDFEYVKNDIRAVKDAIGDHILKVIIETCLLTDEEKVRVCLLAKEAGADFVKTSTGFSTGGATVHDVKLMRETVGPEMGVKASGGVRTHEDLLAMVEAGANRIGTSNGTKIL